MHSEKDLMKLAVRLAVENVTSGKGGPFGAVVVKDGEVVATGVNRVTADNDPTAHAEVNAIREACRALGTFQLPGCVLYTSCEPCPMCMGAIYWVRLDTVYYGVTCRDAAEAGFDDAFIYEEMKIPTPSESCPCCNYCPSTPLRPFAPGRNSKPGSTTSRSFSVGAQPFFRLCSRMSTRWLALLLLLSLSTVSAIAAPIPVKVVVISLFEPGADLGDTPGEYQYWVEREHLDRIFPFPQGYHDLRMNDRGVLGVLTGVGTARAAASIMALGLDARFDFSKAYWLIAGIAGADPVDASLGSAIWSEWVVDGDLAYEIDGREIPPQWTTGYVPLGKKVPYEQPRQSDNDAVFHLNSTLREWAYQQTKDVKLDDSPALASVREHYDGANAHRPPFVLKGDTLASSTFWHGKLLDQWANDWVRYQTDGQGNYVTSAMEDSGVLQSLTFLSHAKRIDFNRVMVLRTVSNFDQPPIGMTAAQSLAANAAHTYSAYMPALEAAYRVGNGVVSEIVTHWDRYRNHIP